MVPVTYGVNGQWGMVVRTVWIVDEDPREAQFIAAVLEYETGAAALVIGPRRFLRRVARGDLPDALVLDELAIRFASPEVRDSLRLVERLLIIDAHGGAGNEQGQYPRATRRLCRPLAHRHVVRAMLWLDRCADDDSWSLPQALVPDFAEALSPAGPGRLVAVRADGTEEAEWEAAGQWSTEYE
jgi:hypothetical protein